MAAKDSSNGAWPRDTKGRCSTSIYPLLQFVSLHAELKAGRFVREKICSVINLISLTSGLIIICFIISVWMISS